MCTLLFRYQPDEKYPLIIAANRDEFYERPTKGAHWWEDAPDLLGGRDLKAGGTWFGITRAGRFATLTNYREVPMLPGERPSRGDIVKDFLLGDMTPEEYHALLQETGAEYQGFNLLFGTPRELYYFSNRSAETGPLQPGLHGLSNHLLNSSWPKVDAGKQAFSELLTSLPEAPAVFDLLLNKALHKDEVLPDTGVGLERERMLSALFIESPVYGTRTSWYLTVEQNGNVQLAEKGYIPESSAEYSFQISQTWKSPPDVQPVSGK